MTSPTTDSASETTAATGKLGRPYAGMAATQRQLERRKKLIDAGVALIGRDGFAAVTIDAVCAEAGLTKRYFYEAFSSREGLLTAAYESVTQEFLQSILIATLPHLQDARQLVRSGLTATFGFVKRHPEKGRLLMIEAMLVRGQLSHVFGQRYDDFVKLLIDFTRPLLVQDAPSDGVFNVMAKGMVGAIIHLCHGWIATDFMQPEQELIEGMERIMAGIGKELGVKGWVVPS
jgi:AcrR family transcriptional regulator